MPGKPHSRGTNQIELIKRGKVRQRQQWLGRAGGYSERCREGPTLRAKRPPRDSEKDGPLEQARTDPGRVKLS